MKTLIVFVAGSLFHAYVYAWAKAKITAYFQKIVQ